MQADTLQPGPLTPTDAEQMAQEFEPLHTAWHLSILVRDLAAKLKAAEAERDDANIAASIAIDGNNQCADLLAAAQAENERLRKAVEDACKLNNAWDMTRLLRAAIDAALAGEKS